MQPFVLGNSAYECMFVLKHSLCVPQTGIFKAVSVFLHPSGEEKEMHPFPIRTRGACLGLCH